MDEACWWVGVDGEVVGDCSGGFFLLGATLGGAWLGTNDVKA